MDHNKEFQDCEAYTLIPEDLIMHRHEQHLAQTGHRGFPFHQEALLNHCLPGAEDEACKDCQWLAEVFSNYFRREKDTPGFVIARW